MGCGCGKKVASSTEGGTYRKSAPTAVKRARYTVSKMPAATRRRIIRRPLR